MTTFLIVKFYTYVKCFLGGLGLSLHLLILKVDLEVYGLTNAANGHAVVDAVLINYQGERVLRHLQTRGEDEGLGRFGSLFAGIAQKLPDVLAALGACFPKFLPPLVELVLCQRSFVAGNSLYTLT